METRKTRLALTAGSLALALALAGCGGGGNSSGPAAASSGGGGGTPDPTPPANAVMLPPDHGIMEAGQHSIPAGMSLKVAGTRFYCGGASDCTVTVAVDDEGAVTATRMGMVHAEALDATGYQAAVNLSDVLLDNKQRDKLRENRYDAEDDGRGVTTSLTTHEEPGAGEAEPLTGISDIFVSVDPSVMPASADHASKVVLKVDEDPTDDEAERERDGLAATAAVDQLREPWTINEPVLDDGSTERTANFVAEAGWDRNPAAEWMTEPALMGATQNMDDNAADIWLSYFQLEQPLAGGRTLDLDLRSDFDPNHMEKTMGMMIARGPADDGDPAKVPVAADMVSFDDITIGLGTEIDFPTDPDMGVKGSYMGVKGTFHCVDSGTDEQGICRVNQHTDGELVPSEDSDQLVFRPYVYMPDTDWITAGVWLTTPDDEEGDYAVGAFVYGNMPYKPVNSDVETLTGTASYTGEAFGRYAEAMGDHKETGRFTAEAALMADFGANDAMGSIHGNLSKFVANDQAVDWTVNFETADLMQGLNEETPPMATADNTALRFNAGASGHANGGHALTGYWNGQFYGPIKDANDADLQPGSAAGTFGLTSERDPDDNYSLILGGAFVTHKQAD